MKNKLIEETNRTGEKKFVLQVRFDSYFHDYVPAA